MQQPQLKRGRVQLMEETLLNQCERLLVSSDSRGNYPLLIQDQLRDAAINQLANTQSEKAELGALWSNVLKKLTQNKSYQTSREEIGNCIKCVLPVEMRSGLQEGIKKRAESVERAKRASP